jgi:uncharacterized protein (DUF924 family)
MATIDDVLGFWFGTATATNEAELGSKMMGWYRGGEVEDIAIRARFGDTIERALAGELDGWAETPRGRLALILVLDQMTRSAFRESARAFAGDRRAQQLAIEMLASEAFGDLTFEERHFVYMPLLHSEDALCSIVTTSSSRNRSPSFPSGGALLADGIEQGLKYRDVIARFGRFPHRNHALGRTSTPEEARFLETWMARVAPKEFQALRSERGRAEPPTQ